MRTSHERVINLDGLDLARLKGQGYVDSLDISVNVDPAVTEPGVTLFRDSPDSIVGEFMIPEGMNLTIPTRSEGERTILTIPRERVQPSSPDDLLAVEEWLGEAGQVVLRAIPDSEV